MGMINVKAVGGLLTAAVVVAGVLLSTKSASAKPGTFATVPFPAGTSQDDMNKEKAKLEAQKAALELGIPIKNNKGEELSTDVLTDKINKARLKDAQKDAQKRGIKTTDDDGNPLSLDDLAAKVTEHEDLMKGLFDLAKEFDIPVDDKSTNDKTTKAQVMAKISEQARAYGIGVDTNPANITRAKLDEIKEELKDRKDVVAKSKEFGVPANPQTMDVDDTKKKVFEKAQAECKKYGTSVGTDNYNDFMSGGDYTNLKERKELIAKANKYRIDCSADLDKSDVIDRIKKEIDLAEQAEEFKVPFNPKYDEAKLKEAIYKAAKKEFESYFVGTPPTDYNDFFQNGDAESNVINFRDLFAQAKKYGVVSAGTDPKTLDETKTAKAVNDKMLAKLKAMGIADEDDKSLDALDEKTLEKAKKSGLVKEDVKAFTDDADRRKIVDQIISGKTCTTAKANLNGFGAVSNAAYVASIKKMLADGTITQDDLLKRKLISPSRLSEFVSKPEADVDCEKCKQECPDLAGAAQ